MPTAIVFDAFGTLIRFGPDRLNPYRHFVHPADRTPLSRQPFLTRAVPIERFAQEQGRHDLIPVIQAELQQEINGLALFDDVEESLSRLKSDGIKIAVCSNLAADYGDSVRRLLPEMDAYVFSFEVGAVKPDPAIFQAVCDALSCKPPDVLFVGDSRRCDVEGPRRFGMNARWLNRKEGATLVSVLDL